MISEAELRRALEAQLSAYAGSDGDWRVFESVTTRDVELHLDPLILLGAGSLVAQPLVQWALANANVVSLIDNPRAGQLLHGRPVDDDSVLPKALADNPDAVFIMCCNSDGAVAYFEKLVRRARRPVLHLLQAMRRAGLFRLQDFSDPVQIAAMADDKAALNRFFDSDSRCNYLALLLYRLSWDRSWIDPFRRLERDIYFGSDALRLGSGEHLVDGGAYDGDTIAHFLRRVGSDYRAVTAFEPDPANVAALHKRLGVVDRVDVHAAGLWSEPTTLSLSLHDDGALGSSIVADGDIKVPVLALDRMDLAPITTIKLDIEAAEIPALQGARQTIARDRPKLAICAYHKPDDLQTIPALLQSWDLGYRLKLRQHSPWWTDAVVYAVPD